MVEQFSSIFLRIPFCLDRILNNRLLVEEKVQEFSNPKAKDINQPKPKPGNFLKLTPVHLSDFALKTPEFHILEDVSLSLKYPMFGSRISKHCPIKSYDLLVKSFALLVSKLTISNNKNIKLCIVGGGSLLVQLKELAEKLNIKDNVVFVGQRTDAQRFYSIFDCFALSSVSEGLSIALLEAMCFSLPVITTCNKKEHDVIVDGQNGFLVGTKDCEQFALAIEKLYLDRKLAGRMGKNNLEFVSAGFTMDRVARDYTKLYQASMRGKSVETILICNK